MNKYLQLSKYIKDCPESLLNKAKNVETSKSGKRYVREILELIRGEFDPKKFKTTYTNNFKKSRFISVRNILKKRQRSCGSMATVVASVMRSLGYPTKLINGFYVKDKDDMRHAWNEIYIKGKWIPFDVTRKDFKIGNYHVKKGEFVDWSDLK
ncbi:transglutaminase-like domain-containing protein [Patescibacteria group bacterium]|nr:transglutaminase-like domain-containing protein [Patescibacteria group bacterium]